MDGLTLVQKAWAVGLRVAVADGHRLVVQGPRRAALVAQELFAHKAEVLAALTAAPPPPDPTSAPEACVRCRGVVFWRRAGVPDLRCARCEPCPQGTDAYWYTSAPMSPLLAELSDPDTRAALAWWYAHGHPEILAEELRVLRWVDEANHTPEARDALGTFIERVRALRDAYWRDRGWGTA